MTELPGAAADPGSEAFRCSTSARARGDAMLGTAAPAYRWLLVEHPGPWKIMALQSTGIDPGDAAAIERASERVRGRAVLVRRPGRQARELRGEDAPRSWHVVDSRTGGSLSGTWTVRTGLREAAAALQEPMRGAGPGWEDAVRAVLVCTHGVHDACCAIRGRPAAEVLAGRWPGEVWECSHLGGDRFAGTMVVLPSGAYYGGVDADEAVGIVAAHRSGAVRADRLRGLSTVLGPVNAAIACALHDFGPAGIGGFSHVATRPAGPERWAVTLAGRAPLPVEVVVAVTRTWGVPDRLTCRATRASAPFRYDATVTSVSPPSSNRTS